MFKTITDSPALRLATTLLLTAFAVWSGLAGQWIGCCLSILLLLPSIYFMLLLYRKNTRKVAFMFNAIDNNDYSFKYALKGYPSDDKLVNESLNRIMQILLQAKADAAQKEKFYELIMDSVSTGVIVFDDRGYVYQTNKEALRLLGLSIFSHASQLSRIDKKLEQAVGNVSPGDKQQVSYSNERGIIHLSIRASEMVLQEMHVRIVTINDINKELDEKEIDSWIRLTRILTHEIMNSITPITSLSDTLLSLHKDEGDEIANGLEVISSTGKSLISFVESYRKFTHIPPPVPSLFYVGRFMERMIKLAQHHNHFPDISIQLNVMPEDLILHADENLITQVMLNLLKNAMQAIGEERKDGQIIINAFTNPDESITIEVCNNGPAIPPEEVEHIFVPFFTTKEAGSGVGLSVSRQIMRLSGGNIALRQDYPPGFITFVLLFP